MVQYSPGTWRDFVWVSAALAGLNLLLMFLFYPESNFHRPIPRSITNRSVENFKNLEQEKSPSSTHIDFDIHQSPYGVQHVDHVHVSWISIWNTFWTVDETVSFRRAMIRPVLFLLYPPVLWAVLVYGAALGAQVILM